MRLADQRGRLERAERLGDESRAAVAVERSGDLGGDRSPRRERIADLGEGDEQVLAHVGIGIGAGEDDRRLAGRRALAVVDAATRGRRAVGKRGAAGRDPLEQHRFVAGNDGETIHAVGVDLPGGILQHRMERGGARRAPEA